MKSYLPGSLKLSVIFLITERCNLRCPFCFLDGRERRGDVPLRDFKKIVRKHHPLVLQISGGEPTMHPDFEKMIRWCARRPMITQLVSNGVDTMNRAGFFKDLLNKPVTGISLDAAGTLHDKIRKRPGLFDRIIETLEFLKSIRAPAALSTSIFGPGQYDALPEGNLDQVEPLVKLAKELRIPIGIQPVNPSPIKVRRELGEMLERLNSPWVSGSPAFIRMLKNPVPGPCLYSKTHISYDAHSKPLPTKPGDCYFLDNCDDCLYACVREPSVIFEGALAESAAHYARHIVRSHFLSG